LPDVNQAQQPKALPLTAEAEILDRLAQMESRFVDSFNILEAKVEARQQERNQPVYAPVIQQVEAGNVTHSSGNQELLNTGSAAGYAQEADHMVPQKPLKEIVLRVIQELSALRPLEENCSGRIIFTFLADENVFDCDPDGAALWRKTLKQVLDNGWHIVQLVRLTEDKKRTVRIVEDILPLLGSRGKYEIRYTTAEPTRPIHEFVVLDCLDRDLRFAGEFFSSEPVTPCCDVGHIFYPRDQVEIVRILNTLNLLKEKFTPLFSFFQHMQKDFVTGAQRWDEIVTEVETQDGDLRLMMMGFGGNTVPDSQYIEQLKPVQERGEKEAALVDKAITLRQKRINAFKSQASGYIYRQIMPIYSMDWYINHGYHSPEAWAYHLGGDRAKPEQQAKHLRDISKLLEQYYGKYEIGLLTGDARGYDKVFWEVKGDHTVLMEILVSGEINLRIDVPLVAQAYISEFNQLWDSVSVRKDKNYVKEWLEIHAKFLDTLAASATS
jgi:hypothetical protein